MPSENKQEEVKKGENQALSPAAGSIPSPISGPRGFSKEEFDELRDLHRLFAFENYKLNLIKGNTARFYEGQKMMKDQEQLVELLKEAKQGWINSKLIEMGYEKGAEFLINMQTGQVLRK